MLRSNLSETFMDRAKFKLKLVNLMYPHRDYSIFYLREIGFNLQQCMELALIHILEVNTGNYPMTHFIETLIALVYTNNIKIILNDELCSLAPIISKWARDYIPTEQLEEEKILIEKSYDLITEFIKDNS